MAPKAEVPVSKLTVDLARVNKPLTEGEVPKVGDKNIPPTTTAAGDLVTAGQRRVNLIWEVVQAVISISVVFTALTVAALLALIAMSPDVSERQAGIAATCFLLLSNLSSLVVGFYFGRTNHQRTGGVGAHDEGR